MKKQVLLLLAIGIAVLSTACSGSKEGIISANEWEEDHPEVYASYMENSEMEETTYGGSVPIDYLEKYPYLKVLYEGNSFSVEYLRARGHIYALEDIINTERSKPGASCLSCKTSGFLELVDEHGEEAHAMDFEELDKSEMETISCYDCHENEPGVINITREHLNTALEGIGGEFKDQDLVCAQCHVEYYLHPDTKEVIMPSVNGLTPEEMLAYYDAEEYSDWVHPSSGAGLLKVQHPEWETYQGSIHNNMGVTCVACHMPDMEGADGETLPSHHWTSPLKSIEASCLGCHQDFTAESLTKRVEDLQGAVEEKMNETALLIVDLIDVLKNAESNGVSEDKIVEARKLHREAQWYWDFVFVENSEGFHNNAKSNEMLDLSRNLTEEALSILN
ncbi:MAG TPA: ammonia-forming cytochrome c nitrite reductase subunit c552 [Proteiniclasticum sp.]|nr:ammonia-forming cytochrome c nitrite reductase subunit c552 [Proteiniclasticum sp.]